MFYDLLTLDLLVSNGLLCALHSRNPSDDTYGFLRVSRSRNPKNIRIPLIFFKERYIIDDVPFLIISYKKYDVYDAHIMNANNTHTRSIIPITKPAIAKPLPFSPVWPIVFKAIADKTIPIIGIIPHNVRNKPTILNTKPATAAPFVFCIPYGCCIGIPYGCCIGCPYGC